MAKAIDFRFDAEKGAPAFNRPAIRERLESVGLKPAPGTPEEFGRFVRGEIDRWAKVAKAANIRAE